MRIHPMVNPMPSEAATRRFYLAFAWLALAGLCGIASAHSPVQPPPPPPPPPPPLSSAPFVARRPQPDLTPSASRVTFSRSAISALDPSVVYVSLPPGAHPQRGPGDYPGCPRRRQRFSNGGGRGLRSGGAARDRGGHPSPLSYTGRPPQPALVCVQWYPPHRATVVIRTAVRRPTSGTCAQLRCGDRLQRAARPGDGESGSVKLCRGTTPVSGHGAIRRCRAPPGGISLGRLRWRSRPITSWSLDDRAILDLNGLALDSAVTIPFTTGTMSPPRAWCSPR